MALINCPECNKEISSTTKSCPNCGYRFKKKVNKKLITSIIIIVCIALVFPICYFTPKLVKYYSIDREVRQCAVKFIKTVDAYNDGDLSYSETEKRLKEIRYKSDSLKDKYDLLESGKEYLICFDISFGSLCLSIGGIDKYREEVASKIGYIK